MIRLTHHISFKHAVEGLVTGFTTQPNFKVHAVLSAMTVVGGIIFKLGTFEWLIIILTITLGLVIELINTAIEFTVDLLTDRYHLLAKYAKDTSAAAMLIYACGSVVVACIIFGPKIWSYF